MPRQTTCEDRWPSCSRCASSALCGSTTRPTTTCTRASRRTRDPTTTVSVRSRCRRDEVTQVAVDEGPPRVRARAVALVVGDEADVREPHVPATVLLEDLEGDCGARPLLLVLEVVQAAVEHEPDQRLRP